MTGQPIEWIEREARPRGADALPTEPNPLRLLDSLLAEQQQLTLVEQFARNHDEQSHPAQERYYRDLIPLSKPQAGEQYAFAVDLDACTGCKACVSACHSLNGLDDGEIWRDVGLIHGGTVANPYQQTITTACHHCVEPACMLGCPVQAFEKDPVTGIVRHLDDQCIGCQYCVLKCPYNVPKYSAKRGIVRKCDMCHGRLAAGEAPACVQACPSGAIAIRIVEKAALTASLAAGDRMVPGAFASTYTQPTTTYTSRDPIPANALPGDDAAVRAEHAHSPLIGMLVLTQIAAGLTVASAALAIGNQPFFQAAKAPLSVLAVALLMLGLAVSVLHLGRPLGAWRAFLGLRTSWMSREILTLSMFAGAAAAFAGAALWESLVGWAPALRFVEDFVQPAQFSTPLAIVTALLGLLGVYCSAMIYVDTHRAFWSRELTLTKFFGTTLLLGTAGAAMVLDWCGSPLTDAARLCALLAAVARTGLFAWEFQRMYRALRRTADPVHRSALVMWNLQRPVVIARVLLFVFASLFGVLAVPTLGLAGAIFTTLAFLLTVAAQGVERYVFFTAVVAFRMPGRSLPAAAAVAA